MVELKTLANGSILQVKFRDLLSVSDLSTVSTKLLSRPVANLVVLFDWTMLESWDWQDTSKHTCQVCSCLAPSIGRIAIVHTNRWYSEAAVVGAILRTYNCEVRSWQPKDHARALSWLKASPLAVAAQDRTL